MVKNKVIAGDLEGCAVSQMLGSAYILLKDGSYVYLNSENVEAYQVIDESYKKSAAGVVIGSAIGAALVGPVGLHAGIATKNKGTHIVAVKFRDDNSLLEVDDKIYKAIITRCF